MLAEPTASVPPFFTRSFTLENLADKVGSALALQHSIPRPKDPLLPARHSFPFLLDQSLLEVPVFERMIQVANTATIPVFPGARPQLLLIVLAPDFILVKITGQRLLEREQILLNQETDVERRWHF